MVMLIVIATILGLIAALVAHRNTTLLNRLHKAALYTILAGILLLFAWVIAARIL